MERRGGSWENMGPFIFSFILSIAFFTHTQATGSRPGQPGSSSCNRLAQVHQALRTMSAEPVVKIAGSPMRMPNTPFTPKRDVKPASQEVPASAEPTSRNENDKLCSQCKTATVMPPATRCKPCHALYNRVYEARKLMDEGSIEVWDKLDRDKKAEFINAPKP